MSFGPASLPPITPPLIPSGAPRVKSIITLAAGPGSAPRKASAVGPSSIAEASGSPSSFMAMRARELRTTR